MSVTFEQAVEKVKTLKQSPSNDELLELYALYKQATVGDVNTDRPGMFDLKGKVDGKKGMRQEDAKKAYIAKYEELAARIGLQ
ncbi:Acyl-CoA-binding protein-like protein 1 [Aphelenchoides fujianensis]|nr:Acyl-CoA-binding protein-like protein 1 [Aphelenchoides fujianensis]